MEKNAYDLLREAAEHMERIEKQVTDLRDGNVNLKKEVGRLEKDLVDSEVLRKKAEARLLNFQNVFKAQLCIDVMEYIKKLNSLAMEGVQAHADKVIREIVEYQQETERAEAEQVQERTGGYTAEELNKPADPFEQKPFDPNIGEANPVHTETVHTSYINERLHKAIKTQFETMTAVPPMPEMLRRHLNGGPPFVEVKGPNGEDLIAPPSQLNTNPILLKRWYIEFFGTRPLNWRTRSPMPRDRLLPRYREVYKIGGRT